MSQQRQNVFLAQGTKKRPVMTHELMGKFKSKHDFKKYFQEACKLIFVC